MLVVGRRPALHGPLISKEEALEQINAPGHAIRIGRDIMVRILRVENGLVRVGIHAPASMAVSRDELPLSRHLEFQEMREIRKASSVAPREAGA